MAKNEADVHVPNHEGFSSANFGFVHPADCFTVSFWGDNYYPKLLQTKQKY
jgi:hypothetical protein